MRALVLLCVALCGSAFTSSAGAATVEQTSRTEAGNKGPDIVIESVEIEAAGGESNAITASLGETGGTIVLSDPAAALTAAAGCTQRDERTVECKRPNAITAVLGDANDSFVVDSRFAGTTKLDGGPGDDTLTGGGADDSLLGGGGRDVLRGGPGDDTLGDGDGAAPDADVLDGGGGSDKLNLQDHTAALTLDLPSGRSSEGDAVSGFEQILLGGGANRITGTAGPESITGSAAFVDAGAGADMVFVTGAAAGDVRGGDGNDSVVCTSPSGCVISGGRGDDMLQAGDGEDRLDGGEGDDDLVGLRGKDLLAGGPGDDALKGDFAEGIPGGSGDTLRGGPGRDRLYGGSGSDDLDGGSGADLVLALDAGRDKVTCGAGNDRLLRDRRDPRRPASCERIALGGTVQLLDDTTVEDGEVSVDVGCPDYVVGQCKGVVTVSDPSGHLLGRRRYRTDGGQDSIDVVLNAAGRRTLKRGRRTIVVRARGGDGTGGSSTVSRRYRVQVD